ncbi:MAG: hypothetical protein D3923_12285, partial [Candidatus Electrothrix sp. AR3]|nr:hypothetical protein [Candidatus Electrothrix sp. AR3]
MFGFVVISNNDGGGLEGLYLTIGSTNPHDVTIDGADVTTADFGLAQIVPTYAIISSFAAYLDADNQTVLEWKTDSEIGTIGFHLERLNEQNGKYHPVTKKLLPGMLSPPHGGTYRFIDKTAKLGKKYTYRVVEVAVNGQGTVSGPYTIQAVQPLPDNRKMFADGPSGFTLAQESFSVKQLSRFNAREKSTRQLAKKRRKKTGNTLKIPVSKDGLVYLTAGQLAEYSGLSKRIVTKYLKAKKYLLTLKEQKIAVLAAKNGSALWFYGQAPSRKDIGQNIYRLELGKRGVKIKSDRKRAKKPVFEEQSFTALARAEENISPVNLYINTPIRDFWAWEYLLAYNKEDTLTQRITVPNRGEGSALITLNLVNVGNRNSGQAAPYRVSVFLNGVSIGTAEHTKTGDWQFQAEVSADLLQDADNEIKIVSTLNTGVIYSFIYLDSIEVEYQRHYQAVNGELTFGSGDYKKITVTGLNTSKVLAFDITQRNKPVRMRIQASKQKMSSMTIGSNNADEYMVTLITKPDHEYFITENITPTTAHDLLIDTPSELRHNNHHADYIIISPTHMLQSAQRLADYREDQGLHTMVVDIEDVQDEFSHGLAAPEAVRDF